jgi:histidine triad (HIT) family protein
MNCLFCQISKGEIPADIVYEDDQVVAFRDIAPQAPTHILIIPRSHFSTLNELNGSDTEIMGHLVLTAQRIASQLGLAENGYRLVMNCNRDGGQTVFHIHLHLLGGRQLSWPPG